jgi:ankyrin repeat protein
MGKNETILSYIKDNRNNPDINKLTKILSEKTLEEKTDIVNKKDENGKTALHHMVSGGGDFSYVKFLLDNGADVSIQDNDNNTALDIAADQNQSKNLLFLASYYQKSRKTISEELKTKESVKDALGFIEYALKLENNFGNAFKKMHDNNFDFAKLNAQQAKALNDAKEENARIKNPDLSPKSSSSEESYQANFAQFGFENQNGHLKILSNFLTNFASEIITSKNRTSQLANTSPSPRNFTSLQGAVQQAQGGTI